jgi:hypothetical protein
VRASLLHIRTHPSEDWTRARGATMHLSTKSLPLDSVNSLMRLSTLRFSCRVRHLLSNRGGCLQ